MATIKLFGNLRKLAEAASLEITGGTAGALLTGLCAGQPTLQPALFDSAGQIQPHIRILLNGHDIALAQGLATPVHERDQLAIFPPLAGG
jgi:molybdopterin synthase sulfur carrier subunit